LFATGTIPGRRAQMCIGESTLRRAGRISLRFQDAHTRARKRERIRSRRSARDILAGVRGAPSQPPCRRSPVWSNSEPPSPPFEPTLKTVTALDQEARQRALVEVPRGGRRRRQWPRGPPAEGRESAPVWSSALQTRPCVMGPCVRHAKAAKSPASHPRKPAVPPRSPERPAPAAGGT